MITYDTKALLYADVPTQFTVRGETINADKRYFNQFDGESLPAITLHYARSNEVIIEYLDKVRGMTERSIDTITYQTGTTDYDLEIEEADILVEVIGTVSGSTYTFLSTEYQLDTVNNQIEFIGPSYPDDGTDFTVLYHHQNVRIFEGGEYADILFIDVYTRDMTVNGTDINGIIVADEIANELHKWFEFTVDINGLLIYTQTPVTELDDLSGATYRRRRHFELQVRHTVEVETTVENIETVTTEIVELNP